MYLIRFVLLPLHSYWKKEIRSIGMEHVLSIQHGWLERQLLGFEQIHGICIRLFENSIWRSYLHFRLNHVRWAYCWWLGSKIGQIIPRKYHGSRNLWINWIVPVYWRQKPLIQSSTSHQLWEVSWTHWNFGRRNTTRLWSSSKLIDQFPYYSMYDTLQHIAINRSKGLFFRRWRW